MVMEIAANPSVGSNLARFRIKSVVKTLERLREGRGIIFVSQTISGTVISFVTHSLSHSTFSTHSRMVSEICLVM